METVGGILAEKIFMTTLTQHSSYLRNKKLPKRFPKYKGSTHNRPNGVAELQKKKKKMAMAWIDYRKAYDMVPHSWILETLRSVGIAPNIQCLIQESMPN